MQVTQLGLKTDISAFTAFPVGSGFAAAKSHNDYNALKKSPFFAKKQYKNQFVFCPDFNQKPHEILNFSPRWYETLLNILQINNLIPPHKVRKHGRFNGSLYRNSLVYKTLKQKLASLTIKMQKTMQFFTRFCITFSIIFHWLFIF